MDGESDRVGNLVRASAFAAAMARIALADGADPLEALVAIACEVEEALRGVGVDLAAVERVTTRRGCERFRN